MKWLASAILFEMGMIAVAIGYACDRLKEIRNALWFIAEQIPVEDETP